MKLTLPLSLFVLCAALLSTADVVRAADPPSTIAFDETFACDALGDCVWSIDFTLDAASYASWHQRYGQNKSLIKRDMGKLMSQFDMRDWEVKVDEMERRIHVGVTARGAVKHKGGGRYEYAIPKTWKGGDLIGTTLSFNYIEAMDVGVIGHHNIKLVLPAEASEIVSDGVGDSGERVVRYAVPTPGGSGGNTSLLIAAGALGLVGVGALLVGLMRKRGEPAKAT